MNPYFATILSDDPDKQPDCVGDWVPFFHLIDRPNNADLAADLVETYCGKCPVSDTCLAVTRDEDENWAPAAHTIRQQLSLIARRNADAA